MDLSLYVGRWVALIDAQVVGVGTSAETAQQMARHNRPKETATLRYVDPGGESLPLSSLMADLRPHFDQQSQPVYLVGGAVRDALLGRVSHDLDFAVPTKAISLAFAVGNALDLPAYVLDRERDTARVMVADHDTMLDFARLRGDSLLADLRDRDFTINALALPATAESREAVIDLVGGLDDLAHGVIRQLSPDALAADPARVLRAIRQAHKLGFTIESATAKSVTAHAPALRTVSAERINDELVKLLDTPTYPQAVADLVQLGVAAVVVPELSALDGMAQSPPHYEDVLGHTLSVLSKLQLVERALSHDAAEDEDPLVQTVHAWLSPFSAELQAHLAREVDGGVSGGVLLRLSALFHDVGKPATQSVEDGRIRFFNHDTVGAELAEARMRALTFSNAAVRHVVATVANHMRPLNLVNSGAVPPSRRAIYRFFKAAGEAGIDVVLLSLADVVATMQDGISAEWGTLAQALLSAAFTQRDTVVAPTPLLNGNELMETLGLRPSRLVGELLAAIVEAQAAGEIDTREQALTLARTLVEDAQ